MLNDPKKVAEFQNFTTPNPPGADSSPGPLLAAQPGHTQRKEYLTIQVFQELAILAETPKCG